MTTARRDALGRALARLAEARSDPAAWRALVQASRPFLLATVSRRLGGDVELAEEAVQDAYVALASIPDVGLMHPTACDAYLIRAAMNAAISRTRGLMRRAEREGRPDVLDRLPDLQLPDFRAQGSQFLSELERHLTPDERQLLHSLIKGSTTDEIAAELAVSYSAAAVRIHRLRRKLHDIVSNEIRL